jgi:hypothetical protein
MVLGATHAQAATYNYSQSFGAFGSVSGQFTGADGNGDGIIDANDGEVSVMNMNYTGGLGNLSFASASPFFFVNSFVWDISEIGPLSNPMTSFDIQAMPESGAGMGMWWLAGMAQGYATNGVDAAGTLQLFDSVTSSQFDSAALPSIAVAPVTPVPEPESYLMMALGLAGLAAAKRSKLV